MEQQKTETRSITAEQRKRVEVCFRSLALIGRNCEYLSSILTAPVQTRLPGRRWQISTPLPCS